MDHDGLQAPRVGSLETQIWEYMMLHSFTKIFNHTLLPFRKVNAGPWAVICLDCCTVTYNPHMEKAVAEVSDVHRGEVRVFSPMQLPVVTPTVLR